MRAPDHRPPPEFALEDDPVAARFALEATGTGLFDFDPMTGVQRFSARCRAIWGLAADETPTAARLRERVHPEDRHLLEHAEDSLRPDGPGEFSIVHRIVRPDGAVRWVQAYGRTEFEGAGSARRAVRCLGTMQDVTDRVEAYRALAEAEADRRWAVELSPQVPWSADPDGRIVDFSERWLDLTGLSREEALGDGWIRAPHPEDLPRMQAAWAHATRTGEPYDVEHRIRVADGGYRWMRSYAQARRDADGRVVRWYGTTEDIDERRRAQDAMRASEQRFQLAEEGLRGHVYDADVVTGRVDWSPGIHELTGYGPDEVQSSAYWWIGRIHPEDLETVRREGQSQIASGVSRYELQYRIRCRDGSVRWVLDRSRLLRDADGRLLRNVGSVVDITAIKDAERAVRESEQELAAAMAELERADRRKDRFLATLSHELRNPLAPIRTAAQVLAAPQLDEDRLAWARQVIQRQVAHMALLLDDLLDVARITQGKLTLKRERVALPAVVDAAVEAARPLFDRKQHRLTVSLPAEAPVLDADPLRLAQVLSNLLTNAAKYTDPGGHVELRARVEAGALAIEVADDGIGIPPAALSHLFEMFSQVEGTAARAEGGLGIGLALVRGLVELHGGTIEAESAGAGRGSAFRVRLPLAPTGGEADGNAARDGGVDGGRRRVLVADDNRDAADALAMLLDLRGHEVRVAYDGPGALALAQGFRPQVALLDIGMPGMDGYAVARALRAEPWGTTLRLVALTGWGQEDDRRRAAEAGFDRHLTKPVDPATLEALVGAQAAAGPAPRG